MKNKYQSWLDWILGRWTCPKCRKTWQGIGYFSDCTEKSIASGRALDKRLECICGFNETTWRLRGEE